jgi:type 1 glutamine amidotransferase
MIAEPTRIMSHLSNFIMNYPSSFLKFVVLCALAVLLTNIGPSTSSAEEKTSTADKSGSLLKIHFISGSMEYDSKGSFEAMKKLLEEKYNVTCTISQGTPLDAKLMTKLDNTDKIADTELLIINARRLKLTEKEMKPIRAHWEQGKPIIGIRSACHAFQPEDNKILDHDIFGGDYLNHVKEEPVKVKAIPEQAKHPILEGVGEITSDKLYRQGKLAKDAVVLQIGETKQGTYPVTFIHKYKKARIFNTSLGVQSDFKDEDFTRMITNAIFWTTERDPKKMVKK